MNRGPTVTVFRPTVVRNGVKAKTKTWNMKWRCPATGKRKTRTTGARDKGVARQIAAEKERSLLLAPLGLTAKPKNVAFDQAVADYLVHVAATKQPATAESYERHLKQFKMVTNPTFIHEVDAPMVSDFVDARSVQIKHGKRISPATVNRDLRTISAFLGWAHFRKLLPEKVDVRMLKRTEPKVIPKVVPNSEVTAITDAIRSGKLKLSQSKEWYEALIGFASNTGARRGELLGLTWRDIGEDSLIIHAATSKKNHDRYVPITPQLRKIVPTWRGQSGSTSPDDLVFPWGKKTERQLARDIQRIGQAAGCPGFVLKNLRSTAASRLLAMGIPTIVVSNVLGHSVKVLAANYANTTGALPGAAAALGKSLSAPD